MRILMGICMYLLDIPVMMWIYYRGLEREPEVWRRGRYPLLALHVLCGIFCLCRTQEEKFGEWAEAWAAFCIILILEFFFLANIFWAKKGMRAFIKTSVFLGSFRVLSLGIPCILEQIFVKGLDRIPVGTDYIPAVLGAILSGGAGFFLSAWILERHFYEKLPIILRSSLAVLGTAGVLVYSLIILIFQERGELLLAAVLVFAGGAVTALLWSQRRAIRGEAFYFRKQKRIFEDYSVALDRQNTIVRQMSHDLGVYLKEMKQMIKRGDTKAMEEAAWHLQKEYGALAFVEYSNNRLVNAVLHRKLEVCREQKIRTQIDLAQFDGGFVENTDWLGIFFCLFDNAIEACSGQERGKERFIRVKVKCVAGFEVIVFLNSRQPGRRSRDGRHTTKGSPYEYGVGLHILEEIVGKYGGTVICSEKEDSFQTTVSLQVRDKRQGNAV